MKVPAGSANHSISHGSLTTDHSLSVPRTMKILHSIPEADVSIPFLFATSFAQAKRCLSPSI